MFRYQLFYRGRVQGVGFRYTCLTVSHGFKVTGFVQNQPDGSVKLVAEGQKSTIEAFLIAVKNAIEESSWARIDTVDQSVEENCQPEFQAFTISAY